MKKFITTCLVAMATFLILETPTSLASQLPVDGSITPARQEIKGSRATATWNLYWDGGDRTTFNVRFNYSLGSSTRATYRPSLVVSSGYTQTQVNATVVHTR